MTATIAYLGDANRHFWLTRSMARAMGVNLAGAMKSGLLLAEDYASMVTHCRTCPNVVDCQTWLARFGACATQAPDHCVIANQLNRLAAQIEPPNGPVGRAEAH